jgi:uncharacterized protein (TIGR03437 family)
MRTARTLPGLALLAALAFAQDTPWDRSGNNLLRGAYNFRHVYFEVGDDAGNFRRAIAIWGTVNFDGNGNYDISNARVLDSSATGTSALSLRGTYVLSASGLGFMDSPARERGTLYGLAGQGIFIASSTEDGVFDLLIAAPVPSPAPSTASFSGSYWVAEMNFSSLTAARARDALFQINPNGQGGLGTFSVTGYTGASGNPSTQSISGGGYAFSAGAGTLSFGTSSPLLSGNRILYVNPDQNFIFGGSDSGWDIFAGVRALPAPARQDTLSGLYYQAGLDQDNSQLNTSDPHVIIDTYYGAFYASTGDILGHQRLSTGFSEAAYDYTYSDFVELSANGSHDDFLGFRNILGAGGAIRIGFGQETYLGIHVAVKAPSLSGPGVYLNPTGVVNAGSYSPFTSGVSPGELIRLYGTNLAAATRVDATFPTALGGVQVLVNDRPAPIYAVSPSEVVAVVPFATAGDVAAVRVINNGTASNAVTGWRSPATPGIFTQTQDGLGYAAALHADYTVVTRQNPARPGEIVAVYLTGLGAVTPPVPDGAAGPVSPLSTTTGQTVARIRGRPAEVSFAGLAPQLIGLYQVNLKVPDGLPQGDAYLDLLAPGAYSSQVLLPIGGSTAEDAGSMGVAPDPRPSVIRTVRPSGVPRGDPRGPGVRQRPQ